MASKWDLIGAHAEDGNHAHNKKTWPEGIRRRFLEGQGVLQDFHAASSADCSFLIVACASWLQAYLLDEPKLAGVAHHATLFFVYWQVCMPMADRKFVGACARGD
jgi:hypothetical protein